MKIINVIYDLAFCTYFLYVLHFAYFPVISYWYFACRRFLLKLQFANSRVFGIEYGIVDLSF